MRRPRSVAACALLLAACAYDRPEFAIDAALIDATPIDAVECVDDGDCASGICEANDCVDPSDIAYVDATGSLTAPCTQAEPCTTVARAQAIARTPIRIVVAPGTYAPSVITNRDTIIVGRSVAGARPIFTADPAFQASLAPLVLRHLDTAGLTCESGGSLDIDDLTISGSGANGISARDCDVAVRRSRIRDNNLQGIDQLRGSLIMASTWVTDNPRGGARLRNGIAATVTGSILADNGSLTVGTATGSPYGGADLEVTTLLRFEGNTVANNRAAAASESALVCAANLTTKVRNNLITSTRSFSLRCPLTESAVSGGTVPTGNVELLSVPFAPDYHLMMPVPSSFALDLAEPDIDGQPRPQGALDFGADEVP